MRIIGGTHRGKQIATGGGLQLRPTTDFAKESLFNILANRFDFDEFDVLDLFAGTGSISYEFASRGARSVRAVEINRTHAAFISRTAKTLGLRQMNIVRDDAFHFLTICRQKYDVIFADPPYDLPNLSQIPAAVMQADILKQGGLLIVEHSKRTDFGNDIPLLDHRAYGNVHFSFFADKQ